MHTAPFGCTAHLACSIVHVWRRCSCSSSRIQADRPAPRPRCLRRWGAWIGGACASEYCDALVAASNPSRLALGAGGDETHTEARRRLRRRKLEQDYWDSACLSDWLKPGEGRPHPRPCISGFVQRDLAHAGRLSAAGRARARPLTPHATQGVCRWARAWCPESCTATLSVPHARVSGEFSRPPKADGTAAALMPLWARAVEGFTADGTWTKRLVLGSGGWWESWTWSWRHDRPTLLGAKDGQETLCPIMQPSRGASRVPVRHRNPPADCGL